MHDFIYHTPNLLEEALSILSEHGERAIPIAGGTALVNLMKQNLIMANHLVDLKNLTHLRTITHQSGNLHVGALTTHSELGNNTLIKKCIPLVADAYQRVATIRIRNAATIGGGLVHSDPAQDPPPALMVSNAYVSLTSLDGTRQLPVADLFVDYYQSALKAGELLTELVVPIQEPDVRTSYLQFLPRTKDDYATVTVAAIGRVVDGQCHDIKVALGSVGPTPVRATAVESLLLGKNISTCLVNKAAETVVEQIDPLTDFRGSAAYKRDMAVVFTRRALREVLNLY